MQHYAAVVSRFYLLKFVAQVLELRRIEDCNHRYHVLCMDPYTFDTLHALDMDGLSMVDVAQWEDDRLKEARHTRTLTEYCWTVKPPFLYDLLERNPEIHGVSFLDADLFPFSSLEVIWRQLEPVDVLLYPHRFPPELASLDEASGRYNGGMISFKNSVQGKKILHWWTEKVIEWCYHRNEDGRLGDQKYLLAFPKLFDKVGECSDVGVNVGPWSITGYRVSERNGQPYLDSARLKLFHFHGFKLNSDLTFTAAAPVYEMDRVTMEKVYKPYREKLAMALSKIRETVPDFNEIN